MPRRAESEHPRMLVFGDSLSFHGPDAAYPADEPRLWSNLAAAGLAGHADLVAGIGWTARDVWWSLTEDPRVWAELHQVDAVVLAVSGMDTLPSPLPTWLRSGLRYLRPDPLRRIARGAYLAAQPRLARLTRGRPSALPPRLTVRYLDDTVQALRALRPGLPIVSWLPPVHKAACYGYVHSVRPVTDAAVRAWARRADVATLDLPALIGEHVLGGYGNPDGMHWGWAGHAAVAEATVGLLGPLIRDADPATAQPRA